MPLANGAKAGKGEAVGPASGALAKRRKLAGSEVREQALAIGRRLLIERGPGGVTLASIGDELGMTHANVLYHFGSAAGLQTALMASMIGDLTVALDHVVEMLRTDASAPSIVVDRVFHAFAEGGAGPLAAWIILSGNVEHLEPVRDALRAQVEAIVGQAGDERTIGRVCKMVLMMSVAAFGDAVIGPFVRDMLDLGDGAMRDLTAEMLPYFLPPSSGQKMEIFP